MHKVNPQYADVKRIIREMQIKSVRAVLERLSTVLGVKSGSQLAEAIGVSPQAISSWKSRESVPYAQCVEVAERHGIRLDWLLTGEGAMRRDEETVAFTAPETQREQALLALFRELDEGAQREIQRAAEEKKRLTNLEKRLSELEAVVADGKRLA